MNWGYVFFTLSTLEGVAGLVAMWFASKRGIQITTPPTETASMTLSTDYEGMV